MKKSVANLIPDTDLFPSPIKRVACNNPVFPQAMEN